MFTLFNLRTFLLFMGNSTLLNPELHTLIIQVLLVILKLIRAALFPQYEY